MAFPTAVNDQITDSISQANTKVVGDAPAMAMGNLFVVTGQALSNAAHNATNNQQQSNVTMQASTSQSISTLLSVDTASGGISTGKILKSAIKKKKKKNPGVTINPLTGAYTSTWP